MNQKTSHRLRREIRAAGVRTEKGLLQTYAEAKKVWKSWGHLERKKRGPRGAVAVAIKRVTARHIGRQKRKADEHERREQDEEQQAPGAE